MALVAACVASANGHMWFNRLTFEYKVTWFLGRKLCNCNQQYPHNTSCTRSGPFLQYVNCSYLRYFTTGRVTSYRTDLHLIPSQCELQYRLFHNWFLYLPLSPLTSLCPFPPSHHSSSYAWMARPHTSWTTMQVVSSDVSYIMQPSLAVLPSWVTRPHTITWPLVCTSHSMLAMVEFNIMNTINARLLTATHWLEPPRSELLP